MLREVTLHADWCEMTMSMMREKQFEACERRLFAHPGVGLFAPEATEADAQALLAGSFDDVDGRSRYTLATLLRRLAREERKCILFSTHDLDIALSLCDSVALIDTPTLYTLPADEMAEGGLLERLFSGEEARFDPATRSVRLR